MEITTAGAAADDAAVDAASGSFGLSSTEPCILCGGQQEPTNHMTPLLFPDTNSRKANIETLAIG